MGQAPRRNEEVSSFGMGEEHEPKKEFAFTMHAGRTASLVVFRWWLSGDLVCGGVMWFDVMRLVSR